MLEQISFLWPSDLVCLLGLIKQGWLLSGLNYYFSVIPNLFIFNLTSIPYLYFQKLTVLFSFWCPSLFIFQTQHLETQIYLPKLSYWPQINRDTCWNCFSLIFLMLIICFTGYSNDQARNNGVSLISFHFIFPLCNCSPCDADFNWFCLTQISPFPCFQVFGQEFVNAKPS